MGIEKGRRAPVSDWTGLTATADAVLDGLPATVGNLMDGAPGRQDQGRQLWAPYCVLTA